MPDDALMPARPAGQQQAAATAMRYSLLVVCCLFGTAVAAQTEVDVIDGRTPVGPENQARWETEPAIVEASTATRRHYGARHPGADWEFSVRSVCQGAFTRPGASQFAVLYNVGFAGRCCPLNGLAVVEDGRLVRNVAEGSSDYYIKPLRDVNGNGLDEILSVGSFYAQGTDEAWMSVFEFQSEGRRILTASPLHVAPCGGMLAGEATPEAQRVTVVPGPEPEFYVYQYRRSGCDSRGNERGRWALRGIRTPLSVPAPDSTATEGEGPVELLNVH